MITQLTVEVHTCATRARSMRYTLQCCDAEGHMCGHGSNASCLHLPDISSMAWPQRCARAQARTAIRNFQYAASLLLKQTVRSSICTPVAQIGRLALPVAGYSTSKTSKLVPEIHGTSDTEYQERIASGVRYDAEGGQRREAISEQRVEHAPADLHWLALRARHKPCTSPSFRRVPHPLTLTCQCEAMMRNA